MYYNFLKILPLVLVFHTNKMGVATKIDEYVPATNPTNKAKAKLLITRPPPIHSTTTTISVVNAVNSVRDMVCWMLAFNMSYADL